MTISMLYKHRLQICEWLREEITSARGWRISELESGRKTIGKAAIMHGHRRWNMSCLLQCRMVKSLMFSLLKPTNRDTSKRAEVQSTYPRVTFKNAPGFLKPSRGASLLTFDWCVFRIHWHIQAGSPYSSGDPAFPVKTAVFVDYCASS